MPFRPNAQSVLTKLTECDLSSLKPFTFIDETDVAGRQVLLSRTGYTGEDGFELYCRNEDAVHLFKEILAAGEHEGLVPCGLGARDTLRFEAKLALYGQELTKDITPIEAGIGFAVKHKKDSDFFGKSVLREQKEKGAPRKLVGLEMIEKGIPRHGYAVKKDGVPIGEVTTGTQSPTLKKNIGLALIKTEFSEVGTEVEVEIRKKTVKAKIVRTPFYKRPKQS